MKTICCFYTLALALDVGLGEGVEWRGGRRSSLRQETISLLRSDDVRLLFVDPAENCMDLVESLRRKVVLQSNWLIECKGFPATKMNITSLALCVHTYRHSLFFWLVFTLNLKERWWPTFTAHYT